MNINIKQNFDDFLALYITQSYLSNNNHDITVDEYTKTFISTFGDVVEIIDNLLDNATDEED